MSFAVLVLDCIKVGVTLWEWQNDQGNFELYEEIWNMCIFQRESHNGSWGSYQWIVTENPFSLFSAFVSLCSCCHSRILASSVSKRIVLNFCVWDTNVQGLFVCLFICFITIAMYWYNYERFKKMMCKNLGAHEPTFFIAFTSGAASGSVSMSFCF